MEWVITVLGVGLVVVVVRDVFHTLFHPVGHGSIAPQVMKLVWRLLRLFPSDRRIASLTGPLGITAVIITWGVTAVLGWMLIYFPQMPNAVSYSSELNPAGRNELIDSLYLSLVTVATLGFGDMVPTSPWLRVAAPLEALFGFMLVTAAVSWVLQIYPALHRRRVLALQLSTLARRAGRTPAWRKSTASQSTCLPRWPQASSRPATTSPSTAPRITFATSKLTLRWRPRWDTPPTSRLRLPPAPSPRYALPAR